MWTFVGAAAGVLLFDLLLTLPAAALLFGVLWCLQHAIGRLDGMAQIAWNLTVIFSLFGVFVSGTIVGLVVGCGVAARVASGTSLARALAASRVLHVLFSRTRFVRSVAQ